MEKLTFKLTGVRPLLMHNSRLADPTDELVRELKLLTGKRKKTDEDLDAIKWLEWAGGLYLDGDGKISIPADMILATIIAGARKLKEGKNAEAGVFDDAPFFPLKHDGPNDPAKLKGDKRFCDYRSVRNQANRVMRARPIFRNWSTTVTVMCDPEIINPRTVTEALTIAGERIGIGDYRPRYGRFTVEKV